MSLCTLLAEFDTGEPPLLFCGGAPPGGIGDGEGKASDGHPAFEELDDDGGGDATALLLMCPDDDRAESDGEPGHPRASLVELARGGCDAAGEEAGALRLLLCGAATPAAAASARSTTGGAAGGPCM